VVEIIALVGPTASGKTGLAIQVAKELRTAEVVNADAMQLYHGMDIGTAKLSSDEMQGIPHHLLSVIQPTKMLLQSSTEGCLIKSWKRFEVEAILQLL
jgi:tRNA dimethylallyltransferase